MIDTQIIENFNTLLAENNITISVAESITAGLIASSIASIPGSSSVLKGGIICYNKSIKMKLLGVKEKTLETFGAESIETTVEMVHGLNNLDAELNIAITGVASKPVGEYHVKQAVGKVFLAIEFEGKVFEFANVKFYGDRNTIREQAVYMALYEATEIIKNFA